MDVWFSTDEVTFPDFLVHVLSGALAFTTTLSLLMSFLVCKMNKGNQSLTLAVSPNMVRYSAQKTVARVYERAHAAYSVKCFNLLVRLDTHYISAKL